jgi:hypothetical protein
MEVPNVPTIELDVKDFQEEAVAGETTEAESSEAETTTTEADKTEAESKDDAAAETDDTEGEEEADAEKDAEDETKTEETDVKPKGLEARKAELNSEIRSLVSRRNELRTEVSAKNAAVYKPATAAELEADGMDPVLARVEASEQRAKMAEYNAYVTDLTANLNTEALQVMVDFPQFDPQSSEYDSVLAKRAQSIYEKVAQIKTDPKTGLTIQANVLPYDIYKAFAETSASGSQRGEVKGQQAAEKMLAHAETPSSSGEVTKKPKEDPFLAGLTKGLRL